MNARVLIVMFLIAGAIPALAQSAEDPFEDLHASLRHAAAQQLELMGPQNSSPKLGGEAGSAGVVAPQETTLPIALNASPSFIRLHTLLPVIRSIFQEEGVPQELILVGLVESGYQSDAVSPAQAVGMWQFVPATARRFGLINEQGDFRTDVLRSTRAAARYLKVLLEQFQDWRLALAAYNAGEDRVEEAISKAQSRDFSRLSRLRLLPEETLNYVPAVLSAIAEARNHGLLKRSEYNSRGVYE
jgi:hypothetical protein